MGTWSSCGRMKECPGGPGAQAPGPVLGGGRAMSTVKIKVGPEDNGRRMSLADFEFAEVKEGYRYELERGVLIVSDVPNPPHLAQIDVIRDQLTSYKVAHRGRIHRLAGGSDCKLLVEGQESERHPDLAVYK